MPSTAHRIKEKLMGHTSPSSTPSDSAVESPKSSGISNLLHPHSHSEHHKSHSTGEMSAPTADAIHPVASNQSASSIASNPSNYLTDQQLEQDLELEAMAERQGSIGHSAPPVDLSQGQAGGGHHHAASAPALLPPTGLSSGQGAPPPPAAPAAEKPSGGMYGNNMFGGGGGGGKKKGSKQKFAERQARKKEALLNSAPPADPDWTDKLEKERQEEIRVIGGACEALGREIHEIAPDGHCMFNAISDQLYLLGLIPTHQAGDPSVTRRTAAQYMRDNKDDFIAFLPSVGGEDTKEATEDGMMTDKGFEKYCRLVAETGEWGGEPEIQALSRAFKVPIHVIQSGPPTIVSHGGADDAFAGAMTPEQSASQGDNIVRISYHRRMYGLGEHYNSLRKV